MVVVLQGTKLHPECIYVKEICWVVLGCMPHLVDRVLSYSSLYIHVSSANGGNSLYTHSPDFGPSCVPMDGNHSGCVGAVCGLVIDKLSLVYI